MSACTYSKLPVGSFHFETALRLDPPFVDRQTLIPPVIMFSALDGFTAIARSYQDWSLSSLPFVAYPKMLGVAVIKLKETPLSVERKIPLNEPVPKLGPAK